MGHVVIVAAMGRNGVIGIDGKLPWHLPEDLQRFKRLTLGSPVIMGRSTFVSIGRPLPGRTNIVLTRRPDFGADGVEVADGTGSGLELARRHAGDGDLYVIGGGEIYRQFIAIADRLELTVVDAEPEGDAHFPDFDRAEFDLVAAERHEGEPAYEFQTLDRRFSRADERDNVDGG